MAVFPNITSNCTTDEYKNNQYINGYIKINSKHLIDKAVVIFDRCKQEGIDCEYFQSWTLNDICSKLNDTNQIWSRWYSSFDPPMVCPVNKIYYRIKNATIEVDQIIRLYPDATNYQWKVKQIFYSGNVMVGGFSMEVAIFGYRKKLKSILRV